MREMLPETAFDTGQMQIDPPPEVIENQTRILMRQALSHDITAYVLLHFADRIRNGDDVLTALDAVFAAHPLLEEQG